MTALIIGVGLLAAGSGGLIGLQASSSSGQDAVGWTSVVFLGVGLFAAGYGLARVLA